MHQLNYKQISILVRNNVNADHIGIIGPTFYTLITTKINVNVDITYVEEFDEAGGSGFDFLPWPYKDKIPIIGGMSEESKYMKDLIDIYDAKNIAKSASLVVGGKGGGGRQHLAQAGGNLPEKADKIFDEIKKLLKRSL